MKLALGSILPAPGPHSVLGKPLPQGQPQGPGLHRPLRSEVSGDPVEQENRNQNVPSGLKLSC